MGLRISEEGLSKSLADGNVIAADIYRQYADRFRGLLRVLGVDVDKLGQAPGISPGE
jgi:hypothetical protein